jgi:hypothetical protein
MPRFKLHVSARGLLWAVALAASIITVALLGHTHRGRARSVDPEGRGGQRKHPCLRSTPCGRLMPALCCWAGSATGSRTSALRAWASPRWSGARSGVAREGSLIMAFVFFNSLLALYAAETSIANRDPTMVTGSWNKSGGYMSRWPPRRKRADRPRVLLRPLRLCSEGWQSHCCNPSSHC